MDKGQRQQGDHLGKGDPGSMGITVKGSEEFMGFKHF